MTCVVSPTGANKPSSPPSSKLGEVARSSDRSAQPTVSPPTAVKTKNEKWRKGIIGTTDRLGSVTPRGPSKVVCGESPSGGSARQQNHGAFHVRAPSYLGPNTAHPWSH